MPLAKRFKCTRGMISRWTSAYRRLRNRECSKEKHGKFIRRIQEKINHGGIRWTLATRSIG